MNRFAVLLAATALASPALAADIINEEPPAPVAEIAPIYDWSGLYIGGQAGAAFGGSKGAAGIDGAFPDAFVTFRDSDNVGFAGGGHIGYDFQFSNIIVGGVADFNYIDRSRAAGVALEDFSGDGAVYANDVDVKFYGTVRGKVGYAMDRFAVYATGGLAYGDVKNDAYGDETLTSVSGTTYDVSSDTDKKSVGYSVGAGADFLATQDVSFGLEYLYTDLGKAKSRADFTSFGPVAAGDPAAFSAETKTDVDFHTVMAKATYHFN